MDIFIPKHEVSVFIPLARRTVHRCRRRRTKHDCPGSLVDIPNNPKTIDRPHGMKYKERKDPDIQKKKF